MCGVNKLLEALAFDLRTVRTWRNYFDVSVLSSHSIPLACICQLMSSVWLRINFVIVDEGVCLIVPLVCMNVTSSSLRLRQEDNGWRNRVPGCLVHMHRI